MDEIKISALPTASTINADDIVVLNQEGITKTAAQSLLVSTVTPQSIGAIATTQLSSLAKLDGSGHLQTSQIPAISGDIIINAGSVTASVVALQGKPIDSLTPTTSQMLVFNGSQWTPKTITAGTY
jgi:hypothetical protein